MKCLWKAGFVRVVSVLSLLFLSCVREQTTMFKNVSVITMSGESVLEHRDVYVSGNRITAIVETGTGEENADTMIDGTGKYLMPGLADMHVHLYQDPEGSGLPLYLANGVTTIRDCNGRDFMLDFRKEIESGKRPGPRLYCTTYTIRGFEDEPWRLVRERYTKGFDAVKFYSYFPSRTSFHRAMQEAKALHAYTIGHIPYKVGLAGIIEEGMNEVAHVEELAWEFADIDTSLDLKGDAWLGYIVGNYIRKYGGKSIAAVRALLLPEAREIARRLRDRQIPVTTTLYYSHILDQKLYSPDDYIRTPYLKYLPIQYFINMGLGREKHQQQFREIAHLIPVWQAMLEELLCALDEADITIVGGTDAIWDMGIVPGFSLHNELAYFVDIGFTPYEALRFCTVNAGIIAGRMQGLAEAEFGTIEAGMRADLVLLATNPLEDIDAVRRNCGVMADGRWYSPEACAQMLVFDERKHQDYLALYEACSALTKGDEHLLAEFIKESVYDDIVASVYTNMDVSTKMIELLHTADQPERAIEYFKDAVAHNWDDYRFLAIYSWRAGVDMKIPAIYPDAIRAVERALELNKQAGVYETIAWLYAYSGDYDKGIAAMNEAKTLDPDNAAWDEKLERIEQLRH